MEHFKIEAVNFTYPERSKKALSDIHFSVQKGEFVLLCGKSGCGKTTLLRLLKPSLAPTGEQGGSIYFEGQNVSSLSQREEAAKVGFVMQSPENQIVTDTVWHELAFGLENLGMKTPEIRARVSEMASFFGIQNWFHKKVTTLSGGQKQILNLAAVMVMHPSALLLDEPTSQLDPIAASEFFSMLEKINRELGTTIILTEHRLEEAFPIADRVIVLDRGKIIANEIPAEVGRILKENGHAMFRALPTPMRIWGEMPNSLPCPRSVREGRLWLSGYAKDHALYPENIPEDVLHNNGDTAIEIKDAHFRYEKNQPDVLKGLNLSVKKGEVFCILGGNGTGKTTALSLVAGLIKPYRGEVRIEGYPLEKIKNVYDGRLGMLPQNPQSVFIKKTVRLDLLDSLSEKKLSTEEKELRVQEVAALCEIEAHLDAHPYDLSGGEQQRAALSKILLTEPRVLLLDEPTKGMDAQFKEEFACILQTLTAKGVTVLMVSHDIEFCAEYADRCALFFDGSITSTDTPRAFFKGKNFYTTAANRMAREHLPDAVLLEDIILALGGEMKKPPQKPEERKKKERDFQVPSQAVKPKKKMVVAPFLLLLLIPLTIYFGRFFFGNRRYYFISLLVLCEAILPFLLAFESRKPKARELVVISVLCAIAVAGRAAFFMLPQVKPVVALIIIAGACLGGETGFLVGAVTAFVSNFFAGQGPWTPWQMFALGSIGFMAGLLFEKGPLKKTKTSICIFGFLATFILYGGIMNPASVLMWQNTVTWKMIATAYGVGLPFDCIHALSTAVFLWFLAKPMMEKLERVKVKYGFFA